MSVKGWGGGKGRGGEGAEGMVGGKERKGVGKEE